MNETIKIISYQSLRCTYRIVDIIYRSSNFINPTLISAVWMVLKLF